MKNRTRYSLTRRQFIQTIAAFSAGYPLSAYSLTSVIGESHQETYQDLSDPWLTLASVQEHLFPATDNYPGAKDIAALRFLQNMMDAPDTDTEEKEFIIQGVTWLNDLSNKVHQKKFIELNSELKEKILRQIETSRAGSRWLSLMMTYLIESLLSDPVYGGNKDQKGWQWLEHIPGFPTPSTDKVYFKLGAHASTRRRTKA